MTTTTYEVCGYCGRDIIGPAFSASEQHLPGCVRYICTHGKRLGECKRKACAR